MSTREVPLWWADTVDDWTTDDVDGSRIRRHEWTLAALGWERFIVIEALEVISADGARRVDPDVGLTIDGTEVAETHEVAQLSALADALAAAVDVMRAMAEHGVGEVAR